MKRFVEIIARYRFIDLVVAAPAGLYLGTIDDRWLATNPERTIVYAAVFAAATTLLGFVVGALAVIKGIGDGPRITELRRRHGATITGAMQGATWALVLLSIVSLGALIEEDGQPGPLSLTLVYGILIFSALRLIRMTWIIGIILSVGDADDRLSILKGTRQKVEPRSQQRRAN